MSIVPVFCLSPENVRIKKKEKEEVDHSKYLNILNDPGVLAEVTLSENENTIESLASSVHQLRRDISEMGRSIELLLIGFDRILDRFGRIEDELS